MNNKYQEALDVLKRIDFRESAWQMEDLLDDRFPIEIGTLQELIDIASQPIRVYGDESTEVISIDKYHKLEKALDKACEKLNDLDMKLQIEYCGLHVTKSKEQWKEWLLKDE